MFETGPALVHFVDVGTTGVRLCPGGFEAGIEVGFEAGIGVDFVEAFEAGMATTRRIVAPIVALIEKTARDCRCVC